MSNSVSVFFMGLLCWGLSLPAQAFEKEGFELGVGSRLTQFNYNETLTLPAKSSETATFATIQADARYHVDKDFLFFELKYEFAVDVASNYNGAVLTTGAAATATDSLGFANYELIANATLTPWMNLYLGAAYRIWTRYIAGSPGYNEIYSWSYFPVGAQFWFWKTNEWEFGTDISVRPTSNGLIQVITSATYSGGQDSQMNLGSVTGYKLAFPVNYNWSKFSLLNSLWYEHSEIGQSNLVTNTTLAPKTGTGIYEPASKTDQYGLEVLLTYNL